MRIGTLLLCLLPGSVLALSQTTSFQSERLWPTLQQPWYFYTPYGMASDSSGMLYFIDSLNFRVVKMTESGVRISAWGSFGTGFGQFSNPRGIAISPDDKIYVTDDSLNPNIQVFDTDGKFLAKWSGLHGTVAVTMNSPTGIAVGPDGFIYVIAEDLYQIRKYSPAGALVTTWGSQGQSQGQFLSPQDITVSPDNHVFVVDGNLNRVQKFNASGAYLADWGTFDSDERKLNSPTCIQASDDLLLVSTLVINAAGNYYEIKVFDTDGNFIREWGEGASAVNRLGRVTGIEVTKSGSISVTDYANSRIATFAPDGQLTAFWQSSGLANGYFRQPEGVAVGPTGDVFVADTQNNRIQKFGPNGNFITQWGQAGTANGQFNKPTDIAVGSDGTVYVVDSLNHRIQKFTSAGVYNTKWGSSGTGNGQFFGIRCVAVAPNGNVFTGESGLPRVQVFNSSATHLLTFSTNVQGGDTGQVFDIAVDASGNPHILRNWGVKKYNSAGTFVSQFGSFGSANGQFNTNGGGIAFGPDGTIFVADLGNHRIQQFNAAGSFLKAFGGKGTNFGQLNFPEDVAVNSAGQVYVVEYSNNRVQKFKPVTLTQNAKAIVVAGGGPYPGNYLWEATQASANFGYRAMNFQGFTKDTIQYLTADTQLDLDDNGVTDDVDGDATLANLQNALTVWAPAQLNGLPTGDVVLYLVDHGGPGTFRMSGSETLDAATLAGWLNTLQAGIQGKLIVVYDACESGSFMTALSGFPGDRIVIASTSANEQAYFVSTGTVSFSNYFWTQVFNGLTVQESFDAAVDALGQTFQFQTPLLDDNGNGAGNDAGDGAAASTTHIGNGTQLFWEGPTIGSVSPTQTIDGTATAALWADPVTDSDGVARVWAVIRPPNLLTGDSSKPVTGLPSVDFAPAGGNRWEAEYSGFTTEGTYTILVYARDSVGNTSAPVQTQVNVQNPLSRKALIVAGGDTAATNWPAVESAAMAVYSSLRSQGYSDDDIYYLSLTSTAGVDILTSKSNIEFAVTDWTSAGTQDFTMAIIGPMVLGGCQLTPSEFLPWSELDGRLDQLQTTLPGVVTVVADGDTCGTIIPLLRPETGKKRILIASAYAGQCTGDFADGNASFTRFFFGQVANGATAGQAFGFAAQAMRFANGQEAALDDNGDGVYLPAQDGAFARNYYIGNGMLTAGDEPLIGSIVGDQTLTGQTTAEIWVEQVSTTGTIDRVLALITPTGGCYSVPVELTADGNGRYTGVYAGFGQIGTYNVSVTAIDTKGQESQPAETIVTQTSGPANANPDDYETDDTPAQAQWIGVDAWPDQQHNLHQSGDEDWVQFAGTAGASITIETNYLGVNSDTLVELYRPDGVTLIDSNDNRGAGDVSSHLTWTVDITANYFVRVRFSPDGLGAGFGAATEYSLRVWREAGPSLPGNLHVAVVNSAIAPVPGASIALVNQSTFISVQLAAFANGTYYFAGLDAGLYTLSATASGYQPSAPASINITSGLTINQQITLQLTTGSIQTTLTPAGANTAGAQWRVDSGAWQNSGTSVSGLNPGSYTVSFKDVSGWITPASQNAIVTAGNTTNVNATYVETGSVQVTIEPSGAVTAGAQWRVDGGSWQNSGTTVNNLAPGAHTISFGTIAGWNTPADQNVTVVSGETAQTTGTYTLKVGALSVTIAPAGAIAAGAKWRVDGGAPQDSGATVSGLPIGDHTLSFDALANWDAPANKTVTISEGATSNDSGTYIRHTGSIQITIEPAEAAAAGAQWQVNGGTFFNSGDSFAGLAVGQHNVDFSSVVGWAKPGTITVTIVRDELTSETGIYAKNRGSITTIIEPAGAVTAGAQWRVDGGAWQNSGSTQSDIAPGSHIVQFKPVTDWTTPDDQNVTVTSGEDEPVTGVYAQHTGSILVNITPAEAVSAGAQWKLDDESTWRNSGTTATGVTVGNHAVSFKSVDGWVTPTVQLATVTKDQLSTHGGTYTRATIAKPTNLQASDGTFTDKVQLTWTGVAGAASYKIFRASTWNGGEATTIGTTSGTTYDDFTAAAPSTTPPPSGGCGGSGGPGETNYVLYIYWVQALGAGGIESDWCDPNDGYRGGTAKLNDWFDAPILTVYERALPSAMLDDGTRAARPNDSLAVRMRADDAIDPESLAVSIEGVRADDVTVEWMPVGNEANDGWAVVRHTSEWPVGTTITLSAEATTDAGEVHQSDTITFTIVPQDTVLSDPPAMDNALGETYITEATGPFATPLEIRIPVPEGHDPSTLALYYYLVDGENAGWRPVENVVGLLQEPATVQRTIDDRVWILGTMHGGSLCIARVQALAPPAASGMAIPGFTGGVFVLLCAAATLVALSTRRKLPDY